MLSIEVEVDIPFDFDMIQTFLAFYIVPEESIPTYEFQKYLISYDLDLFAVSRLISLGLLTLNGNCLEKIFMGGLFYEKISLKILDFDFYERIKKIKSPIDYIDKYLISKFSEQSNYSE